MRHNVERDFQEQLKFISSTYKKTNAATCVCVNLAVLLSCIIKFRPVFQSFTNFVQGKI